jgi:hypothetical protein
MNTVSYSKSNIRIVFLNVTINVIFLDKRLNNTTKSIKSMIDLYFNAESANYYSHYQPVYVSLGYFPAKSIDFQVLISTII